MLLFFISIYQDLTVGSSPFRQNKYVTQLIDTTDHKHHLQAAKIYVQPGDTVLTVTEQLNHQIKELNIGKIMDDFKLLNPAIDPLKIQPYTSYFFPIYEVYH